MDIWQWVWGREEALREDGHEALADYIDKISHYAVNDQFDLVDQVYHAAIPLCRALDDKWLEVYFRHWRLQAHVLKNYDAKGNLHEAISLLDFAHQEETKDCPQRICAVQDLASCYGIKDGPGFAEERISVCRETLAQIDGSWPCYQCVSSELLDALIDGENYKDAAAEIDLIEAEISKFQSGAGEELVFSKTRLLLATGQYDAAWRLVEAAKNPEGGEGFLREATLLKALTLCYLQRWEEAQNTVLSFEEIVKASTYYADWTEIQFRLVGQGLVENTSELRYKFHSLADKLIRKEACRVAFQLCERLIKLCLAANETLRAGYVLETMKSLIGDLHRDLGASDSLRDLERRAAKMTGPGPYELPENVEAVLAHKFETESQAFSALTLALQKWPEAAQLYARKFDLFQQHFQQDAAYGFLEEAYKTHRGAPALERRFGAAFLAKHGFDAYQAEFPITSLEGLSKEAIWNRGFIYVKQFEGGAPEKALEVLKIIEGYWPEDIWLLGQIARQEMALAHYEAAAAYRRKQVALDPDNLNHKWDLLIAGTLNQDTALICEMAEKLKLNVGEDGRFAEDERRGMRLQWEVKDGYVETYGAVRIGPALARITSICGINSEAQLYGREVVFDPAPVNKLDQEDEEGYLCDIDGYYTLLYPPPLLTLHDPDYKTYTLDGLHPGDTALKALSEQVKAAGFVYHEWIAEGYDLTWTDEAAERTDPAIYIYLLIPRGAEDKLHQILSEFSRGLKHPLVWTELVEALGDDALRLEQRAISKKYGIEV